MRNKSSFRARATVANIDALIDKTKDVKVRTRTINLLIQTNKNVT